jgi:hypothetical protein
MPFEIDTGVTAFDTIELVPDWFRDQCKSADKDRIFHDYAYHLIGATKGPVKMATVRDHTLAQWRFLRELAAMHPDVFDEFICAYAERAMAFD